MKYFKYLVVCFLCIIVFFTQSKVIKADSSMAISFSAQAILPKSQINNKVSYFDIHLEPNQKEELHVELVNDSNKEIIIEPSINRARTNSIGVVEYNQKSKSLSSKAQANIEEIAKIEEKEIKLAPNQKYDLKINIKMPSKKLEGIQAGAVYLLEKTTTDEKGNIKNQYAREIGLIVQSSNPDLISSDLTLEKVSASQVNYRNSILVTIENSVPKFIKLSDIQVEMSGLSDNVTICKSKIPKMTVAPNTKFDYPLSMNGREFKAGKYLITFSANEGEKRWTFSKELTINNKESNDLNKRDAVIQNKPNFWQQNIWMLIIIAVLIVAVIILGVLYFRNRRTNE